MGAVAIAKAVASCSSLQKLELDENQISEDGVAHLKVWLLPRICGHLYLLAC